MPVKTRLGGIVIEDIMEQLKKNYAKELNSIRKKRLAVLITAIIVFIAIPTAWISYNIVMKYIEINRIANIEATIVYLPLGLYDYRKTSSAPTSCSSSRKTTTHFPQKIEDEMLPYYQISSAELNLRDQFNELTREEHHEAFINIFNSEFGTDFTVEDIPRFEYAGFDWIEYRFVNGKLTIAFFYYDNIALRVVTYKEDDGNVYCIENINNERIRAYDLFSLTI